MSELALYECLGDDADHLPTAGQHRVGQRAHQARVRTAVHEPDAPPREQRAERLRRVTVNLARAEARTAEHAQAHAPRMAARGSTSKHLARSQALRGLCGPPRLSSTEP